MKLDFEHKLASSTVEKIADVYKDHMKQKAIAEEEARDEERRRREARRPVIMFLLALVVIAAIASWFIPLVPISKIVITIAAASSVVWLINRL